MKNGSGGEGDGDRRVQRKALVADDAPDLLALLAGWLADEGYAVTRASSGREIVAQITRAHFDLLVTDILMPDGDGWDAIAEAHRMQPDLRIIAMSGGTREMPANTVLRAAKAAGAIGQLEKPFNRVDFIAAVRRLR